MSFTALCYVCRTTSGTSTFFPQESACGDEAHTHIHTQLHTATKRYTQLHTDTHRYTQIHTDTHTHCYTQLHTDTHRYTHTHRYTLLHIHTATHFYIHICCMLLFLSSLWIRCENSQLKYEAWYENSLTL